MKTTEVPIREILTDIKLDVVKVVRLPSGKYALRHELSDISNAYSICPLIILPDTVLKVGEDIFIPGLLQPYLSLRLLIDLKKHTGNAGFTVSTGVAQIYGNTAPEFVITPPNQAQDVMVSYSIRRDNLVFQEGIDNFSRRHQAKWQKFFPSYGSNPDLLTWIVPASGTFAGVCQELQELQDLSIAELEDRPTEEEVLQDILSGIGGESSNGGPRIACIVKMDGIAHRI